ncbi:MAG: hypothetical protein ACI9VX_002217, partial [Dinoroseobacter sp.]
QGGARHKAISCCTQSAHNGTQVIEFNIEPVKSIRGETQKAAFERLLLKGFRTLLHIVASRSLGSFRSFASSGTNARFSN